MNNDAFREKYGPWAVVAGASEGLGAAFAEECARRGLKVVLAARSRDKLASVQTSLSEKYKTECRVLALDLSEPDAAASLDRQTALLDTGLFIYNAALSLLGPYFIFPEDQHRATMATNCATPALCAYRFGKRLRERGKGGIVLMSSMAGFQGGPFLAHYAATKAYCTVLAEGLSRECAADNVDVLACCAGAVATPGYLRANGGKTSFMVMKPAAVARKALDNIHRRGVYIPGIFNKCGAFVLQKLLPRSLAVSVMEHSVRGMVKTPGRL
ncbi:MAG TPA: SDR family NAD(P)-dependent oxidoreductase [Chitinivibrionales bacterium]|nr:SDR family NAD(P)-dependent oxidoreductase [Chitinivibrionales bacterium]